jgi:hypothetical protein
MPPPGGSTRTFARTIESGYDLQAPTGDESKRVDAAGERSFMSFVRLAACSLFALLVPACVMAPFPPGEAVRNALAPTGKLRVGLISVPVHAIRDPYSGI